MLYIQKFDNGYYCLPILRRSAISSNRQLTDSQSGGYVVEYSHDLSDLFNIMDTKPTKPSIIQYLYTYSASILSILIAVILSFYFSKKNENSMKSIIRKEIGQINEEGYVRVGKLFYDPDHVLGRGCNGTVVFKGRFDGRDVAVKRILKDTKLEREMLIDCDVHQNVCRYFYTESCNQFFYIALQYCMGTLQDYVLGTIKPPRLTLKMCIQQTCSGLLHLHSLKIIHRDIKPQNILITFPTKNSPERIVISDFGLCRALDGDSMSFSRRSGHVGTEGWMAPETIKNDVTRMSSAVDVFSLGCVIYYVLSGGEHPFGDLFSRQTHIQEDIAIFDRLSPEHDNVAISLIRKMVSHKPNRRPTMMQVLSHPFFWDAGKVLSFLMETSDRIEKLDVLDPLVRRLEANNSGVIKESWTEHICVALKSDLGRFRTYKGRNLRDLLRAIRNKRNHYMELPGDVREALGEIPGEFVRYFTNRFPYLVVFVYEAMQVCENEPNFKQFYCGDE